MMRGPVAQEEERYTEGEELLQIKRGIMGGKVLLMKRRGLWGCPRRGEG